MKTLSILNLTSFISIFIFTVTTLLINSIINRELIMVEKIKENHSVPLIHDEFKDNKSKYYKNAFYFYQPRLKKACYNKANKDIEVRDCKSNEKIISSKEALIFNKWKMNRNPFIQQIDIFTYDYYYKNNYLLKNITLCNSMSYGIIDSVNNVLCETNKLILEQRQNIIPKYLYNNTHFVTEFLITEGSVCPLNHECTISPLIYQEKLKDCIEVKKCTAIDSNSKITNDINYKLIDTMTKKDLININTKNYYDEIIFFKDTPLMKEFLDTKVNLYYKNYIGWKLDCKMNLFDFYNLKNNTSFLSLALHIAISLLLIGGIRLNLDSNKYNSLNFIRIGSFACFVSLIFCNYYLIQFKDQNIPIEAYDCVDDYTKHLFDYYKNSDTTENNKVLICIILNWVTIIAELMCLVESIKTKEAYELKKSVEVFDEYDE